MFIQVAMILSILLQLVAVVIVVSLIKGSKYKSSYIFIASGLVFMAARRIIEYLYFIDKELPEKIGIWNSWLGVLISILMVIGVFYLKKIFGYLANVQKIRQENEKRVLSAIINTEERERKRIAKDLHDGLGPILASFKMSISALKPAKNASEDMRKIYDNAIELADEALNSMKEISNNLSPHILENFGLANAIQSFINTFDLAGKVKIEFRTNIEQKRYDSDVETILYRAFCELMHNSFKHSGAGKILISLDEEGEMLKLLYQDDGKGFDPESVFIQDVTGIGLYNIRSRVSSINGTFTIQSLPGEGTVASIEVKNRRT